MLNSTSFERNASSQLTARGQNAFDTAECFRVFIFPKASHGSILDPFLPNKRQDNLFDTRNGYIRPDALLRDVKRTDGTSVFPALRNNFVCLQQTGDWCN